MTPSIATWREILARLVDQLHESQTPPTRAQRRAARPRVRRRTVKHPAQQRTS